MHIAIQLVVTFKRQRRGFKKPSVNDLVNNLWRETKGCKVVIINKTKLQTLEPLIQAIVKHVHVKDERNLVLNVYWRRGKLSFSGSATPNPGKLPNHIKCEKPCHGYITLGVPRTKVCSYEQWAVETAQTIYHEVSHIWDAQLHGTKHWIETGPWEDKPQEMIAMFLASKKFGEMTPTVEKCINDLVADLKQNLEK